MVNNNNDIDSSSFDIGYSTPMYLDVVSDPGLVDIRVALLEPIFEPLDPIFQSQEEFPPPPPPPAEISPPPLPTTKTQQELLPPPPSQEDLPPEVQQKQDELPSPQQPQQDLPAAAAWLPPGWSIEKRTRVNGVSAGNTDKFSSIAISISDDAVSVILFIYVPGGVHGDVAEEQINGGGKATIAKRRKKRKRRENRKCSLGYSYCLRSTRPDKT
ncbi:hypothetical protein Q3G72_006344 [Acer saccharum]|nr:hypothetical protein Q3G72_006344 [Acer saccharum]